MWKFDGLAPSGAGLSSSNCYSTNEGNWHSNAMLAKASPVVHQLQRRETATKGRLVTSRSQTPPELEKILCVMKYLGPSCFHVILWTQFRSHNFRQKTRANCTLRRFWDHPLHLNHSSYLLPPLSCPRPSLWKSGPSAFPSRHPSTRQ